MSPPPTATRTATKPTPASAYPAIHRGDGWHTHPSPAAAAFGCEVCDEEDRLELEQGEPVRHYYRDGGGLLVWIRGDAAPIYTAQTAGAISAYREWPRVEPADHDELEPDACNRTRATHVHVPGAIYYPPGYRDEPAAT